MKDEGSMMMMMMIASFMFPTFGNRLNTIAIVL